jgi:hypothetical protein
MKTPGRISKQKKEEENSILSSLIWNSTFGGMKKIMKSELFGLLSIIRISG